jgi:hypothetical protein
MSLIDPKLPFVSGSFGESEALAARDCCRAILRVVSTGAAPVNGGRNKIDPHDGAANLQGKYPRACDINNWHQIKDHRQNRDRCAADARGA